MPGDAKNWREKLLREVGSKLDPAPRTHFLGKVPYQGYKRVLQVSASHVYLTYPFVLSWSMLEAMATGRLVLGSDTAPVREVVKEGVNGRLVNMFDARAIEEKVLEGLSMPVARASSLREGAMETVAARFSLHWHPIS